MKRAKKSKIAFPLQGANGFTLIELLVTITLIAILAAMTLGATSRVRLGANSTKCLANLRQIGVGMNLYENENNGMLPKGYAPPIETSTWMMKIAPYIGLPGNSIGVNPLPRAAGILVCPDWTMDPPKNTDRSVAYAMNKYVIQDFWNYRRFSVRESTTFLVVEFQWNNDYFAPLTDVLPRRHPNKSANFLYVDGHAANLAETVATHDPRWGLPADVK